MADPTTDPWQMIFLGGAVLLVVLQMLRGWQLGVVRQVAQVVAVGGAYAAAWIGAPHLAPYLTVFELPNFVLTALAGACIAVVFYLVVSIVSALLFKKTSQQSGGAMKLGYGLAGAFVGMVFGLFLVFALAVAIRLLGSLAEAELEASRHRLASGQARPVPQGATGAGGWMQRIAGMKHSIENGPAGDMVQQLDPIPGTLYTIVQKVGTMVANEQSLQRFMSYPGVKPLAEHPRITALVNDPQIAKEVAEHNFLALLRNPNVVAAANDPEVVSLMRKFEFEKALDYALGKPEKPDSAPPAR